MQYQQLPPTPTQDTDTQLLSSPTAQAQPQDIMSSPTQSSSPAPAHARSEDERELFLPSDGDRVNYPKSRHSQGMKVSELDGLGKSEQTSDDLEDEESFDASMLSSPPHHRKQLTDIGEDSYIDEGGESFVNDSQDSFARDADSSFMSDARKNQGQSMMSEGVSYEEEESGYDEWASGYEEEHAAYENEADDYDHDDARDVMNIPASYVAPSHRPHDLHEIVSGERELDEHEVELLKQRRQELEAEIQAEADTSLLSSHTNSTPSLKELQEQIGAIPLADGVVAVDPEQLEALLSQNNEMSPTSKETGPSTPGVTEPLTPGIAAVLDPDRLDQVLHPPPTPSPYPSPALATQGTPGSLMPAPLSSPPATSSTFTTPPPMDIALPSSTSSQSPSRARAASTPTRQSLGAGTRRISFTNDLTVSETPFTGALKHFKTHQSKLQNKSKGKGKENLGNGSSPAKARRNASLPEEIAELAKVIDEGIEDARDILITASRRGTLVGGEVNGNGGVAPSAETGLGGDSGVMEKDRDFGTGVKGKNEELDRYRDADLAPLDPVFEGKDTGDLIMAGTPVKKGGASMAADELLGDDGKKWTASGTYKPNPFAKYEDELRKEGGLFGTPVKTTNEVGSANMVADPEIDGQGDATDSKSRIYELLVPDHTGAMAKLKIETNASPIQIGHYIRQKGRELDGDEGHIEDAVKSFAENPNSFVIDGEASVQDHEHPVFVNVISLLPGALFEATVGNFATYANHAYDAVLRKMTSMTFNEHKELQRGE